MPRRAMERRALYLIAHLLAVFNFSSATPKRIVCYYTNWSAYRPGKAKFLPININPYLCTHLIYSFGGLSNDFQLKAFDKWQDIDQGGYSNFNKLKSYNGNLKTLLAVGGWNEGSARFSKLASGAEHRAKFIQSALRYLRQHNFDGLDLDWEYPGSRDGSSGDDKQNYAQLVKELRQAVDKESNGRDKLLLSMAIPAGEGLLHVGFNLTSLSQDLDWMSVMSYDYHSSLEPSINHHAPLSGSSDPTLYDPHENLNTDSTVRFLLSNGAAPDKIVVGIPTYGRSYKLANANLTSIGSPASGPADAGPATREKGYLSYFEICDKVQLDGWIIETDTPPSHGPYAYSRDEWVGYDDEQMAATKAQYVLNKGLGGVMFWTVDNDDFRGLCGGRQYPLIEAAKDYLWQHDNGIQFDVSSMKSRSTTPAPPTTPSYEDHTGFHCEREGYYPNPDFCTKYFWCLDSGTIGILPHAFTCPSGLHFNQRSDSCDYPVNVNCATSSTVQLETILDSSKTSSITSSVDTKDKVNQIDIQDLISTIGQLKEIVNSLLNGNTSEPSTESTTTAATTTQAPVTQTTTKAPARDVTTVTPTRSSKKPATERVSLTSGNRSSAISKLLTRKSSRPANRATSAVSSSVPEDSTTTGTASSTTTAASEISTEAASNVNRLTVSKTLRSKPVVQFDLAKNGTMECDRVGTLPFSGDCKKFVKCVVDEKHGFIRGHVFTCPHTWNFDPVFGICRNSRSAFACPGTN